MGLIKAAVGAVGGTLADQWKEYFYCDAMDKETLMMRGQKKNSGRSSNTKGHDNVISNGSGIAVADGQCMIIVQQGEIIEMSAEPGVFVFDTSQEPSIFEGDLGQAVKDTFSVMLRRFTFGGDVGRDQRVYYFNLKELLDNKFGTMNPVPFRVVDSKIGLDIDVSLRCAGVYSYKITNPILFYKNVCGNVEGDYMRSELETQLKSEFISALQPAFAELSKLELRPNEIISHNTELENAMNLALSQKWGELRGLQVVSVALATVTLPEEDTELIKQAQRAAFLRDPGMAGATLVAAQADAMKTAAGNESGAMAGFMGMGMAMGVGGSSAQGLFGLSQEQQMQQQSVQQQMPQGSSNPQASAGVGAGASPVAEGWSCSCGALNQGKFCQECGAKKPEGAPLYICDKCGWQPPDPANPPKFCPDCGDPFNEDDKK